MTTLGQLANIACGEPAAINEGRCGLLGQIVVAPHHAATGEENLPVLRDLDLGTRQRNADSPKLIVIREVHKTRRARLGQPVSLKDEQASGVKELGNITIERR